MFGSNDGMFHVLDARVGVATSGREIFAYVPRSLYPTLKELTAPAYIHRYFVDGPVVEAMYGTAPRGGRSPLALREVVRQDCSPLTSPRPTRPAQRVASHCYGTTFLPILAPATNSATYFNPA